MASYWLAAFLLLCGLYASCAFEFQTSVDRPVYANPDQYGYRYCAYWRLGDGSLLWSTCDKFEFDRCGRRIEFEYRCCTQFKQVLPNVFPAHNSNYSCCAEVIPQWDYCPSVLDKQPGYHQFADYLKFGSFLKEQSGQTFTIFATYSKDMASLSNVFAKYKKIGWKHPVANLIVKNRIYGADLRDGQVLETMGGSKLKVTKYSFGVTCIECAEISRADLECKNGVIHFLRKFVVPHNGLLGYTDRKSVMALLLADARTKSFAASLPADLKARLSDANSGQWYTVLAPTQATWLKLRESYTSAQQVAVIASYHVLPKMYCATGIIRYERALNTLLAGETVTANCESYPVGSKWYERRYVQDMCGNRRYITEEDVMAANGVVHVIDGPLLPSSVMDFNSLVKCADNTNSPLYTIVTFLKYFKECDLRMKANKKYALLIPMNYAMQWWRDYAKFSVEYKKFLADPAYRCRVARYHVMEYKPSLSDVSLLWHQQSGYRSNTPDNDIRYEVDYFLKYKWRSDLYFHYSAVVNMDSFRFSQGSIYRLRRINVIPELTMMQVMKGREDLTITYKKAVALKLETSLYATTKPLNLYLAIRNTGWKSGAKFIKAYNYVEKNSKKFALLHHVPLYLWGGDIGYFENNSYHRFMSSLGIELIFWMNAKGVMRIGHAEMTDTKTWPMVVEFNLHATDGIIWVLDGALFCPLTYCGNVKIRRYLIYAAACNIKKFGDESIAEAKQDFAKSADEAAIKHKNNCVLRQQRAITVVMKDQ